MARNETEHGAGSAAEGPWQVQGLEKMDREKGCCKIRGKTGSYNNPFLGGILLYVVFYVKRAAFVGDT